MKVSNVLLDMSLFWASKLDIRVESFMPDPPKITVRLIYAPHLAYSSVAHLPPGAVLSI